MSISVIRAALETRLTDWALTQSLPIAYQNVGFTKPEGAYLEAILIPNLTMNKEVSGVRKTMLGLFQVNIWTPEGQGVGQAEAIAQGIVNLFPMVPKFGSVSIESTPTPERTRPDEDGWAVTPVLMTYRYEAT
jgi:hypothetical protein